MRRPTHRRAKGSPVGVQGPSQRGFGGRASAASEAPERLARGSGGAQRPPACRLGTQLRNHQTSEAVTGAAAATTGTGTGTFPVWLTGAGTLDWLMLIAGAGAAATWLAGDDAACKTAVLTHLM